MSGPPRTTCSTRSGSPASSSRATRLQRGQRRLAVGAQDHGVAGQQRRDRVGDRHGQRVVPRPDDADDALGVAQLDRAGQQRERPEPPSRPQVAGGAAAVVPAHHRRVGHLLERVHPGLAGLELDQVEQLVLPLQHQVVEAQHDPLAVLDRQPGPGPLRGTGARVGDPDVVGGGQRQRRQRRPGHGGVGQQGCRAGGAHDPLGQPADQPRVDGVRRGGVGLGVGDRLGGHARERMPPRPRPLPIGNPTCPRGGRPRRERVGAQGFPLREGVCGLQLA